jgi:glycine C-acetyltransferase
VSEALSQFLSENRSVQGTSGWRVLDSAQGAHVCINGEWKISLCSNNYLGLANRPALREAAHGAIEAYGVGSAAARSLSGSTQVHEDLERELAAFKHTEAALVFNSGFVTNSGVIPALIQKGDAVFSDELNHGSIIDGCRLSGGERHVYRHRDMEALEDLLAGSLGLRKRMIVADAVFSMDGDIAPIPELVELSERYGAFLMVDEAHATGVLGETGRGAVEHFGAEGKVDVIMGTLGKALGAVGGYIAGSRELIDYIAHTARSFLLTTSLPAMCAAAALAALRILDEDQEIRQHLWENTTFYRDALSRLGFDTMHSKTPIVPILIGDDTAAQEFSQKIFMRGVYATPIGTPYVPPGTSRIRTIITSAHTRDDLETAIHVIEQTGRELNLI